MATSSFPRFSNQDLRQHSFRLQDLQQATFVDCDLRGCNFQGANLTGATFIACRVGYSRQQLAISAILLVSAVMLMLHAISSMVFGALGQLPGRPAWPYVVALYIALAIAATSTGIQTIPFCYTRPFQRLMGASVGALVGFFYGGVLTEENLISAIVSAVFLGILGLWLTWRVHQTRMMALLTLMGAIATYGFAFVLGTTASDHLTIGLWGWGLVWAGLSIFYIGVTIRSVVVGWQLIQYSAVTSFRSANLTQCHFQKMDIRCCDTSEAIGLQIS
ncbi:MAG: pentapeptide repeat-containing protein [Leptolyngbya sp. SIO1D8]|nr:pentapeptide repeat-containing protein [Leptolyngbya sp. SIO1D8]